MSLASLVPFFNTVFSEFNENVAFADESILLDVIINSETFAEFRPRLEGMPHSAPHVYVSKSAVQYIRTIGVQYSICTGECRINVHWALICFRFDNSKFPISLSLSLLCPSLRPRLSIFLPLNEQLGAQMDTPVRFLKLCVRDSSHNV